MEVTMRSPESCIVTVFLALALHSFCSNLLAAQTRREIGSNEAIKVDEENTVDVQSPFGLGPQDYGGRRMVGAPVSAAVRSVVNMKEVATRRTQSSRAGAPVGVVAAPNPRVPEEPWRGTEVLPSFSISRGLTPLVASPSPSTTFRGLQDTVQVGTSSSFIPPDTDGAVGLDKVVVTLNNNIRILDKATGDVVSTASLNAFWSSTGATGLFDPRVLYDPYNDRWIVSAASNASSSSSSICLGVSTTSNPSGTYYLFKVTVGSSTLWADFPTVGFNKNWVAVCFNMHAIVGDAFSEGRVLSVDYPTLRSGTLSASLISGISGSSGGFCMNPSETFSATEDTLFLVSHLSSGGATYKLHTMTGTPALPVLTIGATNTNSLGGWAVPGGEILPQLAEPSPGTGTRKIESADAQMRGNVVYRNGFIYTCQTVGLPAGGLTHTASQWGKLSTTGDFVEGGRVEDPTATATNGGKWYAYPSIAVNTLNDILLGFSQFSSSQYASACYTFKARGDATGTMRDPVVYKSGVAYYEKTYSGTRNRWGDFSHTCVDPTDDFVLWTIQEYADEKVDTGNGSGRWDTWWASVTPPDPLPIQLASFSAQVIRGNDVEITWRTVSETNNYGFELYRKRSGKSEGRRIGFVDGHGTTLVPQTYSFIDHSVSFGSYAYQIKQMDLDGGSKLFPSMRVLVGVEPEKFFLAQNFPNPFNPTTSIEFTVPRSGYTTLKVYNTLGQEVARLFEGNAEAGMIHSVDWRAAVMPSGLYFYTLKSASASETKRMLLMK
jgi:hypothetical protein